MIQNKEIIIKDELFEFKLDTDKKVIINQLEYKRIKNYYDQKLKNLIRELYRNSKLYLSGMSPEDILQELYLVLVKSIFHYNADTKISFNTLFWHSCKNKIRDILKKVLHLREVKKYKKLNNFYFVRIIKNLSNPLSLESLEFDDNNKISKNYSKKDYKNYSKKDYKYQDLSKLISLPDHVIIHRLFSKIFELDNF